MAAEMKYFYTVGPSGTGGLSNKNQSLGGTISADEISATSLNNLFDNISASEALDGGGIAGGSGDDAYKLDYRGIRIKNTGNLILSNITLWGGQAGSGGSSGSTWFTFAKDTSNNTIANETTPPGLNFTANYTEGTALALGSLNVGASVMVWIARHCNPAAASKSGDTKTLTAKAQYAA